MKATNTKLNVSFAASQKEAAQEILSLFFNSAQQSIDSGKRFCAAVSGYTLRILFELLESDSRSKSLPWNQIHFFRVDECCDLSGSGNRSCTKMTNTPAGKVNIPPENVHRICSNCLLCDHAASLYEQTIYDVVERKENGVPCFDLILLQMGSDGHIASLFPDTYAFFESQRLVQVSHFIDTRNTRITMTHPLLYAASQIAIFVSGGEKAEILSDIFTHEPNIARYPIHSLWPVLYKVKWLIDHDAARFLPPSYRIKVNQRKDFFGQQYVERRFEND